MVEFKCDVCGKQFEKYNSLSVHCNRKHKIPYEVLKLKFFPRIEKKFKCKRCEASFDLYSSLRRHTSRIHKITSEDFYTEFYLNGKKPLCCCGCGNTTAFTGDGFNDYLHGHIARVKNNWSKNSPYFEKSVRKSAETRRKQFANGERTVWNDGLTKETNSVVASIGNLCTKENNPNRAKKISKALSGVPKSEEHNKKNTLHWQEYWSKQENRDAQRVRRVKYMNQFLLKKETLLEKEMKHLLEDCNIQYHYQYIIDNHNYDFLINGTKILIECDGDFWHSNPSIWKEPTYDSQINTKKNDEVKNKIAELRGYKLLRFWESDIKENPAKVMKTLLNELNIEGIEQKK